MTPNFQLYMFTASQRALQAGIDNSIGGKPEDLVVRANLKTLATVMEQFHFVVQAVTSGYRCPELNDAIGGHPNSLHVQGLACDFIVPDGWTTKEAADAIAALGIPDLDIVVYSGHVHIELDRKD